MPAFSHTGFDVLDATPGTVRTEMSDLLKVSLMNQPNLLAALRYGEPGGGGAPVGASAQQILHYWIEDTLNPRTITALDPLNDSTDTTFTVSLADGAVVQIQDVLQDAAQSELVAEQMQVIGKVVGSTTVTLTVLRAFNGTTEATHLDNAKLDIVASLRPAGSNLGPDMSRSPIVKANYFQQARKDVVITGEMDELAKRGLVPGIPNQPAYQLHQRFWEMLQDWSRSVIRGKGTPAATSTDTQEMHGILAWLGYSPTPPNATAVPFDGSSITSGDLSDEMYSAVVAQLVNQGADIPDAVVGFSTFIDRTARIFRDQLRLNQAEVVRGYTVDAIRVTLGHKLIRMIMDNYMPDPAGPDQVAAFLDLSRIALIPFYNRGLFLKTSPSMLDAKLVSLLSQLSLEFRNTGTDSGQTSILLTGYNI
jgi:hypothetical protein